MMRRHLTFFVVIATATFFAACEGIAPDGQDGTEAGLVAGDIAQHPEIIVDPEVEAQYGAEYKWFDGDGAVAKSGEIELTPGTPLVRAVDKDATDRFHWYTDNLKRYNIIMRPAAGDADLYTHYDEGISEDEYSCAPAAAGNDQETCANNGATHGEYYAMVKGAEASVYAILVVESPSDCHVGVLGEASFCSEQCPCGFGQGSCASTAECATGLGCTPDVGEDFGMDPETDVCTY